MLSEIGLAVIALGWFVQLVRAFREAEGLSQGFVLLFCLGAGMLAAGQYQSGFLGSAIPAVVSLILATLLFFKLKKRRIKTGRKKSRKR